MNRLQKLPHNGTSAYALPELYQPPEPFFWKQTYIIRIRLFGAALLMHVTQLQGLLLSVIPFTSIVSGTDNLKGISKSSQKRQSTRVFDPPAHCQWYGRYRIRANPTSFLTARNNQIRRLFNLTPLLSDPIHYFFSFYCMVIFFTNIYFLFPISLLETE